jgi:hypothetical protein
MWRHYRNSSVFQLVYRDIRYEPVKSSLNDLFLWVWIYDPVVPRLSRLSVISWFHQKRKFQGTERSLSSCPRHVSYRLPPSGKICKYAMAPITQTNLERFSTYWYAPFCCVFLGFCAAEFGKSGETYELPCIYGYDILTFTYFSKYLM